MLLNAADYGHFDTVHGGPPGLSITSLYHQDIWFRMWAKIITTKVSAKMVRLSESHRLELTVQIVIYLFGRPILDNLYSKLTMDGPYMSTIEFGGIVAQLNISMVAKLIPVPNRKLNLIIYKYCAPTILARTVSLLLNRYEMEQVNYYLSLFVKVTLFE